MTEGVSERQGGRERKGKAKRGDGGDEREGWGSCAVGASFQVSNTTSGDGFKPNSLPPINTQAEREYINCLTITHFEKKRNRAEWGGGGVLRYPSGIAFL